MYESATSVAPSDAGPVPLENQTDLPAPAPALAPGKPVPIPAFMIFRLHDQRMEVPTEAKRGDET